MCPVKKRSPKVIDGIEELIEDAKGLTELNLITNSDRRLITPPKLFTYHRYNLGVVYKLKTKCQHPNHRARKAEERTL